MAPSSIVELAKKGDPKAIAALMNKSLGAKGVTASATRQGTSLEIILQSQRTLNQKTMVEIVQKGMGNLQVSGIDQVLVRSQQGNLINWESEIVLNDYPAQTFHPTGHQIGNEASPTESPKPSENKLTKSAPQSPNNPDANASGIVLLPRLSQLNRSVQKYQDTIIRLTDDTGTDIICLCTLAELIRTLYAPTPSHQTIADAIHKCSSTNGDGEKIIRNVSILQPGQMWQKTQIRCTLQIAFEMDGSNNLAEDTTPAIATEETLLEYPSSQAEDEGEATIIESIAPKQPKTEDEMLTEELERRYGKLYGLEAEDKEDKTIIEAVSAAKIQEYTKPDAKAGTRLETKSGSQVGSKSDSKSDTKPDSRPDTELDMELDTEPDANDDLFGNISAEMPQASPPPEVDVLFNDFVFDATNPPKMINDIDTVSDPTVPPPPQDNLSFTLDDFRSDLLSLV